MNVRTLLLTNTSFAINSCLVKNWSQYNWPESITAADINSIIGLDTKDGFVKMSMETWRRLELFIGILQGADLAFCEQDVQELLDKYRSVPNGEKL